MSALPSTIETSERTRWLAILRLGETQAADALRSIFEPMAPSALRSSLETLWRDPVEASHLLAERLGDLRPLAQDSTPWSFARGTARARHDLKRLHAAEVAWVRSYERALLGGSLEAPDGALVLSVLLPRQRAHPPLL